MSGPRSSAGRAAPALDDSDDASAEPEPEPPLTVAQETRLRSALPLIERAARSVAGRFHRFVEPRDLHAVGTIELHRAVRAYVPGLADDFENYAFHAMRWAMRRSVEEERYQDCIRRAVDIAADQHWAYVTDHAYDASRHDEGEARRRYRAIANGSLAATFMAGIEEAQRVTPETETADREEYEVAAHALETALEELPDEDHALLVLLYRELCTTEEASVALQASMSKVKRHRAEALERLQARLGEQGVTQAPAPRAAPVEGGNVLAFRPRAASGQAGKKPGR
jgi:RNA polymerase sigma factor (sigma-70 family)